MRVDSQGREIVEIAEVLTATSISLLRQSRTGRSKRVSFDWSVLLRLKNGKAVLLKGHNDEEPDQLEYDDAAAAEVELRRVMDGVAEEASRLLSRRYRINVQRVEVRSSDPQVIRARLLTAGIDAQIDPLAGGEG